MDFFVESLIIFVDHFFKKKTIDILYEENICEEFSSVHALTLIFIKKIFIFQTHSFRVWYTTNNFSYTAQICPPLVQLIGHVSA